MELNSLPSSEENLPGYDPQLDAEDAALSSGKTRLGLVVGGLLLAGVLGYALLPAQEGSGSALAPVTPSFMLADASVTASREPAAASAAAAAPAASEDEAAAPAAKTIVTLPAGAVAATVAVRPAPGAPTNEAAPAAIAPAAVAVAPVSAAGPAAVEPVRTSAGTGTAAGSVTLTGRILDENGRPLVGATVLLKGSGKGTGTDANGTYKLEAPAGDNTLIFGYGGYQDEETRVHGTQFQNVTLTPTPGGKRRGR